MYVLFTQVSTSREKEARSSVSFEPAGFNEFCPASEPKVMKGHGFPENEPVMAQL